MSDEASIFIGSSSEQLDYANALQSVLDNHLVTSIWCYGIFLPGENTLSSLITRASVTDFAALFLTPDDEATVRGEYLKTPRDNLIFELGLFIGQLGPGRVFLLTPREGVDLPNDLQGLTTIPYRTNRGDDDTENAVNPAATTIRKAVRRHGPRPRSDSPNDLVAEGVSIEVLTAIGRLGGVAAECGGHLEVRLSASGRYEIIVVGRTGLGTSVEVDLSDSAGVHAIDNLESNLGPREP
jgi:hypothetical protein